MELWVMKTEELTGGETDRLLAALPPSWKARVCVPDGVRQDALWAYSLLRFALQRGWGLEQLPELKHLSGGKPVFSTRQDIHFNISHTAGAVLVGLDREALGVDLERDRKPPRRLSRLLGTGDVPFFSVWVCWEACAKCLGQGVLPLLRMGALPDKVRWNSMEVLPGYWAGAATVNGASAPLIRRVERAELLDES